MDETMQKYGDIINLPHYKSKKRPPMIMIDRAAQFAPFAALTGHADAIKEEGRYVEKYENICDEKKIELDKKLQILSRVIREQPEICITYFSFDDKKDGGVYKTIRAVVKKIKLYERQIVTTCGEVLPIDLISDITGEIFNHEEI